MTKQEARNLLIDKLTEPEAEEVEVAFEILMAEPEPPVVTDEYKDKYETVNSKYSDLQTKYKALLKGENPGSVDTHFQVEEEEVEPTFENLDLYSGENE